MFALLKKLRNGGARDFLVQTTHTTVILTYSTPTGPKYWILQDSRRVFGIDAQLVVSQRMKDATPKYERWLKENILSER